MFLTTALVLNYWIAKTFGEMAIIVISFQAIFLWVQVREQAAVWQVLCVTLFGFQVLFYLLPFKKIGPLVSLIGNVLRSIIPFVLLLATVMTGFTLAFRVLFSAKLTDFAKDKDASVLEAFKSPGLILQRLFYSILGDVASDVRILSAHTRPLIESSLCRCSLFSKMTRSFCLSGELFSTTAFCSSPPLSSSIYSSLFWEMPTNASCMKRVREGSSAGPRSSPHGTHGTRRSTEICKPLSLFAK